MNFAPISEAFGTLAAVGEVGFFLALAAIVIGLILNEIRKVAL